MCDEAHGPFCSPDHRLPISVCWCCDSYFVDCKKRGLLLLLLFFNSLSVPLQFSVHSTRAMFIIKFYWPGFPRESGISGMITRCARYSSGGHTHTLASAARWHISYGNKVIKLMIISALLRQRRDSQLTVLVVAAAVCLRLFGTINPRRALQCPGHFQHGLAMHVGCRAFTAIICTMRMISP